MKHFILFMLCACAFAGGSQNAMVCADDGFEGLSNGPIVSSVWSASYSPGQSNAMCMDLNAFAYTATNSLSLVKTTPVSDTYMGTVEASPFAGNKVALLNQGGNYVRTRFSKTITVSSSNYLYRYAYKAMLGGASSCGAGMLLFSFYDCSGNPISVITKTIQPALNSASQNNPDGNYWTANNNEYVTPQWIVTDANLSGYLGSCVQVRVDISPCTCGGHNAFAYFDDMCSNSIIGANPALVTSPNNSLVTTGSYMSCANTATLLGLPGFSSYTWQGPAGTVSGSTLSTLTTTVSGMYTLTATSGTNTFSQQVNLTVNPLANTAIAGNTFVCQGHSLTLSASGAGLNAYSWSTGSSSPSVVVTPTTAFTTYVLTTTNNIGCVWTASTSIYRVPQAIVNIVPPAQQICAGQTASIGVGTPFSAYQWNNGAVTPAISVSPSVGTQVYTLSVTDSQGCITSNTVSVTVLALPQLQIVPSATAICVGQQASLSSQVSGAASYGWSTGSNATSISVNPSVTTTYVLSGTSSSGCSAAVSFILPVNPLPQPQITGAAAVCAGQPANLSVQGGNMAGYLWNTGSSSSSVSETPALTTLYSVTVTSTEGCQGSSSKLVTVNALPQLQTTVSDNTVCDGEAVILTASSTGEGSVTYAWNTGASGASLTNYPSDTFTYAVTGTDANGCSSTVNTIVTVSKCLGIAKNTGAAHAISVFPNPASSNFTVKGYEAGSGQIINSLGQMVYEFTLNAGNNFSADVSGLAKGVYFVRCADAIHKVIIR